MDEPRHLLAKRLRECMDERGDSPRTLAAEFGIRPQSVDSWLREGRISKQRLPALARRYGRSVEWLLGLEEPANSAMPRPVHEAAELLGRLSPEGRALGLAYLRWLAAQESSRTS
jgi:transcriptional regulator with XRE-family HTH domain